MILIASHSTETLNHASRATEALAMVNTVSDIDALRSSIQKANPRLVLLDLSLPDIDAPSGIIGLLRLNPEMRIVVMGEPACDADEIALFKHGVRGCCPVNSDGEHYRRVITAVLNGEIWIRRSLTTQLLEQLGNRAKSAAQIKNSSAARLSELTKREREIAYLIAEGENNKLIARKLDITERTVKAHLTEIFRKLQVSDRLKLALLMSANA
jgi:DNA-binding NarL/FixJ family response regulator